MALLNESSRVAVWEQIMRENKEVFGALTRQELRAAVDAADQWAEDNASAYNLALPQPARGVLTAKQKAMVLMFVIDRRFGVL